MAKSPTNKIVTVSATPTVGSAASRQVEYQVVDGRLEADTNPGVLQ